MHPSDGRRWEAMMTPGPDGWEAGFHALPPGWPAMTRRLRDQRWLVDATISQVGVDWDQGRTRYIGAAGGLDAEPDFARVRETVRKLADIEPAFAAGARRRETRARAAQERGHPVPARTHAFIASILWGAAEWTFFLDRAAARRADEHNARKLACYDQWLALAPHPVRRLRIPYGDGSLSAVLHLPVGADEARGSIPATLHVGGMDSFKEHAVAMLGDRFLQRGIARLIFDGPGQGEAILEGAFVSRRNMVDAGLAALEVLGAQPEIDPSRIGVTGVSFGSWWATQIAAHASQVAATAVWAVVHEPGLESIFEVATPTFKARFMAMAGFVDEDAFDAFARRWTLDEDAPRVTHPYLVVAGEEDELSPIVHTYRLLGRVAGQRQLILYRGERHSVGGGAAARLGPNHLDAVADWLADRFAGRPVEEDATIVETTGQAGSRPLDTWLEAELERRADG
jgi:dienelactone hydrolase